MAGEVTWSAVEAVLDDPDVSSQTKAALLDAYAVAQPDARRLHADDYAASGGSNSAGPPDTPPRDGASPGPVDGAPDAPDLGGLGVPTQDAAEVARWTDTRAVLAQAKLEGDSVGRVASWEKKVRSGPDGVGTADELLAAGAGGLTFFRLFVPPYRRARPTAAVKFADYQQLYDAEHGLDFAVFLADATVVRTFSTTLGTNAADLVEARDRLTGWGGEAGPAARSQLSALADRMNGLAAALADGDKPTALAGLLGKGVATLQNAVLQKATTVAALKSTTVFRSPALTAAELGQLLDAAEPDATDDALLDAAAVMRAEQMPTTTLLNPAVRSAIRTAAQTWVDGFVLWFTAVDTAFRTACSTAATAVPM